MSTVRNTITKHGYKFGIHIILSYDDVKHQHSLTVNRSNWNEVTSYTLSDTFERDAIKWFNINMNCLTDDGIYSK